MKQIENKIGRYMDEITEKVNMLIKRQECYGDIESLIAFRGESSDFKETKLMPSLFRNLDYIDKENYLFELLKDYDFFEKNSKSHIEQAIESQHYLAISRLLDISFSILPALYFACNDAKDEDMQVNDGVLYIFCFPEYYSPHSDYIEKFYSEILNNKQNITYPSNFKVISHSYSNQRIRAQVGGFIFFPGNEFRKINSIYYETVIVKGEDKKTILNEMHHLFSVNEATLFPEKERLVDIIKRKLEKNAYYQKDISVREEVMTYFQRIEYELEMEKQRGNVNHKLGRYLRKEKYDLKFYVDKYEKNQDEKKRIHDKIEKEIIFLKLRYGGEY